MSGIRLFPGQSGKMTPGNGVTKEARTGEMRSALIFSGWIIAAFAAVVFVLQATFD